MTAHLSCLLCAQKTDFKSIICENCRRRLPVNEPACSRCGVPVITLLDSDTETICEDCFKEPPPFLSCFSPFLYQFPLNQLVSQMKYNSRPQLCKLLGQLLAERLQANFAAQQPWPELLIPIPMHPTKQRQRGYNQSIYLAQVIGRSLKIPVAINGLKKIKLTEAQNSLDRSNRLRNLSNSLVVNPRFKNKLAHMGHVAIVDDVITTGATMYEASSILQALGIPRVDIWALARTP